MAGTLKISVTLSGLSRLCGDQLEGLLEAARIADAVGIHQIAITDHLSGGGIRRIDNRAARFGSVGQCRAAVVRQRTKHCVGEIARFANNVAVGIRTRICCCES